MMILKRLLGDFPLETFLEKNFTKLPFSVPNGARDYIHLLDWRRVKEVLDAKESVLRIVQDGQVIKDYVELDFEEARSHHKKGHTLLLRFAEKSSEALRELSQDFSSSFHTNVDIQLYCTPEGHNAFGWHYDVEEVFIIQTQGSKQYTIRPNTIHPNPLVNSISKDLGYEKENSSTQLVVTLEPGDWLYIPSGWWHIARTQKESMHISIGLMPSSALDILSYLPKYLAQNTFWRTRMPVHKNFDSEDEEVLFYQSAMETLGKDLVKHVSSKDFIKQFLMQKKGKKT